MVIKNENLLALETAASGNSFEPFSGRNNGDKTDTKRKRKQKSKGDSNEMVLVIPKEKKPKLEKLEEKPNRLGMSDVYPLHGYVNASHIQFP